jgi:hypothetical protein
MIDLIIIIFNKTLNAMMKSSTLVQGFSESLWLVKTNSLAIGMDF